MDKNLTRRAVLKAAPVVAVPLVLGTAQANEPDAELITLFKTWEEQNQLACDLEEKLSEAEAAALNEYPEQPKCVVALVDGKFFWCEHNKPFGEATLYQTREDIQIAVMDKWETQVQAIDDKHQPDELSNRATDASDDRGWTEADIKRVPAQSMTGILIKLKVWENFHSIDNDNFYDGLIGDVMDDAKRFSGMRRAV